MKKISIILALLAITVSSSNTFADNIADNMQTWTTKANVLSMPSCRPTMARTADGYRKAFDRDNDATIDPLVDTIEYILKNHYFLSSCEETYEFCKMTADADSIFDGKECYQLFLSCKLIEIINKSKIR